MFDKMYESDTILICLTKCISVSSERLILAKNRLLHSIQHVKISWSRWSVCLSVTLFCPILIFTKVTQVWTRGTQRGVQSVLSPTKTRVFCVSISGTAQLVNLKMAPFDQKC